MPTYPLLPINLANQFQPIRGLTWSVKEDDEFKTIVQESDSGRKLLLPRWLNNRHKWEFVWEFIKDNPKDLVAANAPWTDFQLLKGFRNAVKGGGGLFLYQPPYSLVISQPLAAPDANNNTELVYTVGAYAVPFTNASYTFANVQVLNNLLIIDVVSGPLPSPGDSLQFSGVTTATFLNGLTLTVVGASTHFFSCSYQHANYGPTSDSGIATRVGAFVPVTESVQYMTGLSVFANGAGTGSYTLAQPNTVAPYPGYVLQWSGTPVLPITTSFNLFYLCRFSDDSILYENWSTNYWMLKSLKVEQFKL